MVYASASTGFRLPSFNSRPFQPSQITQIAGDEILAYELGVKADLFDRRLRLNATAFYTDYKTRPAAAAGQEYQLGTNGQPIVVPGGGSVTTPLTNGPPGSTTCRLLTAAEISAGTVGYSCVSRNYYYNNPGKVKGFELEADAEPIDHLTFNLQVRLCAFHVAGHRCRREQAGLSASPNGMPVPASSIRSWRPGSAARLRRASTGTTRGRSSTSRTIRATPAGLRHLQRPHHLSQREI